MNDSNIFEGLAIFFNQFQIKNNLKIDNQLIEKRNKYDINHFNNLLNFEEFKIDQNIYFANNPKRKVKISQNKITEGFKLNINYEKKKINEIREHIKKIQQFYQDKTLIESVFYPNKATQKQLSTKGSEIDILSLIIYTICPVQEPMIYLEDKGGMVRDYSISIIIDNSKTCFNDINEKHSYLTIIN